MIHTFGVWCGNHHTIYIPNPCACGEAHGWMEDACMPDCPEFDWAGEFRTTELEELDMIRRRHEWTVWEDK